VRFGIVVKKQQNGRFLGKNRVFSCFTRSALAESQQLPDNREAKLGARDITDLVFF
jgi:hypothetical protein